MIYKRGDKVRLKSVEIDIEIQSVYPGSQGVTIRPQEGQNYYSIILNGIPVHMAEETIVNFVNSGELVVPTVDKPVDNIEKPIEKKQEVKPEPVKVKRGVKNAVRNKKEVKKKGKR